MTYETLTSEQRAHIRWCEEWFPECGSVEPDDSDWDLYDELMVELDPDFGELAA